MKRLFFGFSVLSLCFSLAYPRTALAQQKIAVRSGAHEDYSRVVFDWGRAVEYTIDESHEKLLIIRFKEAGRTDLSGFDSSKLENVTGFRVIKNDPLTVSMIVPEDSKVKAFALANSRVVVDIYNPPKQDAKAAPEKKEPEKKPESEKEPPKQADATPEKKPEPVAEKPAAEAKTEEPPAKASEKPEETPPLPQKVEQVKT